MTIQVSGNLIISYYLLKNAKLWIWDWDDTLINVDAYMLSRMDPDEILNKSDSTLDTEVPSWRYFRKLIEYLVGHGVYVAIASFGTYEIIQAYMNRILGYGQKFFNKANIIAPCLAVRRTVNFRLPSDKNEYIYELMKKYRIQDFSQVVLFDDMSVNIAQATAIGVIGIQIDSPRNSSTPLEKCFFGPWTLEKFDKKIKNTCGEDLYLNRKYAGVTNIQPYKGLGYDKVNFGTGVREKMNVPFSFGSGIGDRKISKKPDYQWNNMNVPDAPIYWGGNYYIDPDDVLCDQEKKILNCKSPNMKDYKKPEYQVDINNVSRCPDIKKCKKNTEGFENHCTTCQGLQFDKITIILFILFLIMSITLYYI